MTKVPNFGIHSLETEYLEAKRAIYKKFVKFFCIIIIGTILTAVYQTFDLQNLASSIKPLLPLSFFIFVLKYLYCLPNQELGGMVIYLAFYLNGLYTNYYDDNGLGNFKNPENAFYFGCYYGILERLVTERVCKPKYKVYHTIMASAIRLAVVFTLNPAHYILQVAWACVTIYLDLSQEKYNNHLFTSYFNYKEQLIKFKDLVVNDIPEGLAILSKDLLNTLFTNKHFNDIVSNPRAHIRRQLDEFIIQETISDFDPKSKDFPQTQNNLTGGSPRAKTSPFKNKTLLTFLQDKLSSSENPCSIADFDQNRTFSCRLSHVKNPFASADSRQEQIFEARIFPITWEKQSSIAIILHDITLHHTILSLQLADLHKDAVLATVSHELRTPLNGMLGIIQIMQKKVEEKELLNYLSICEKSGELLIGLVNSILDLNQIRANTLKLYPEAFNLSELMKDVMSLFELQCDKKDLYLKLNIAPELPKAITTDKNRLTQIFINLIGNALKFTFQGGITVSAFTGSEKDSIKFVVEDTGIGIEDEDKEKLFKIFGKIHHSNNENLNKQGVGLGLTISNKLASLLNNHNFEDLVDDHSPDGIQMKSLSGVGSIFTFEIKADLVNPKNNSFDIENTARQCNVTTEGNEEDLEETNLLNTRYATCLPQNTEIFKNSKPLRLLTRPKSHSVNKEKSCILLVDDNSFNLMVAEVLVRTYGYEVVTASHGQKAIELVLEYNRDPLKKLNIKLILMDCQMPVMDGYKATLVLREMMRNNRIEFIPIIALTANDSENERKRCLEVGMVDHLSKPLKDVDLKNILRKFVKN